MPVPFQYEDGYRGELVVVENDGEFLPVSLRSRSHVHRRATPRRTGGFPPQKWVTFGDWRLVQGWRIPHEIRIVGSESRLVLRVRKIEFLGNVDPKRFRLSRKG